MLLPAEAFAAAVRRYSECRDLEMVFKEVLALPPEKAPYMRTFIDVHGMEDSRVHFERMLHRIFSEPAIRASYLMRIERHIAKGTATVRMRLILGSDAIDNGDLKRARVILEDLLNRVQRMDRLTPFWCRWLWHKGLRFFQLFFRHMLPITTVSDCSPDLVQTERWERSVLFQLLRLAYLDSSNATSSVSHARRLRSFLEARYDAHISQEDTITKYALSNLYLTLLQCRAMHASCNMPAIRDANAKIITELEVLLSKQDLWNAW